MQIFITNFVRDEEKDILRKHSLYTKLVNFENCVNEDDIEKIKAEYKSFMQSIGEETDKLDENDKETHQLFRTIALNVCNAYVHILNRPLI